MATFGNTGNQGSTATSSADRKRVTAATPASSGVLTKLTARLWLSGAGSTTVKAVVYSDVAGEPSALLATGDEVTITHTTEQEVELPFSGGEQISIVGGTQYWIGVIVKDPGTPNWVLSRGTTTGVAPTNTDTYSDGPTNPFGTVDAQDGPLDVYGTYTEGGGAALLKPKGMDGGMRDLVAGIAA